MHADRNDHLARARDYIAKGEDFYRKAAEEIIAAKGEGWTVAAIARELDRDESSVRALVAWATNPEDPRPTPWAGQYPQRSRKHRRTIVRGFELFGELYLDDERGTVRDNGYRDQRTAEMVRLIAGLGG